MPYTCLVSLSCQQAAFELLGQGIDRFKSEREQGKASESQLYFFGRETHPLSYREGVKYQWGKPVTLVSGTDATLVATGPMVEIALNAAEELSQKGIKLSVIDHSFVNQPDVEFFAKELANTKGRLITLEDHQVIGGMGALLTHKLTQAGANFHCSKSWDQRCLRAVGVFGVTTL